MGWVIFVIVVLLVLGIARRRTTRTRTKMSQQLSVLQSQAHLPRQPPLFPESSQPMPAPPTTTQAVTRPLEVSAMYLPVADPGAQPATSTTTLTSTTSTTSTTHQRDPTAQQPVGGSQTYRPVGRGKSRPKVDAQALPQRYQGSTAVSGSSLSTTLCTPYQPSSLMTSLSSSLSSSLTDSPPRVGTSTAFIGVEVISLPAEVAEQVRFHLRNGHEVEAVRLVCETMDVGLLEATKTVRSYA